MPELFSSSQHLLWFLLSITLLAVTALHIGNRMPLAHAFSAAMHLLTAIEAVIVVSLFGNGPVYSVHCIWFNSLLALVHLVLWRRRRR